MLSRFKTYIANRPRLINDPIFIRAFIGAQLAMLLLALAIDLSKPPPAPAQKETTPCNQSA